MKLDDILEEAASFDPKPPPPGLPLWALVLPILAGAAWLAYDLFFAATPFAHKSTNVMLLVFVGALSLVITCLEYSQYKEDKEGDRINRRIRMAATVCQAALAKKRGQIH